MNDWNDKPASNLPGSHDETIQDGLRPSEPSNPQISVAMCTYNGVRFLGEQLNSILQQTRLPDQVVICDDGSTDSTAALLEEFARSAPFPVELHFNSRTLGVTRNFEQALAHSSGDHIALCDQDDLWHPHKLQQLSALLVADPRAGFACSNADLIDEQGKSLHRKLWNEWRIFPPLLAQLPPAERGLHMLRANCVTGATMMLNARLMRDYIFPLADSWVHDHWLVVVCEIVGHHGVTTPESLTHYRQHSGQTLGLRRPKWFRRAARTESERRFQQGLQRLRDLQSHLESPAMSRASLRESWVHLTTRAVRDLTAQHRHLSQPWWLRGWHRLIRRTANATQQWGLASTDSRPAIP
ncbi:MAG: glycosyltransferase family 2 protein [Planctomycetes bacterium]|nr:glycosyltransferase family 2 protein [Planctomycetota bacterium]